MAQRAQQDTDQAYVGKALEAKEFVAGVDALDNYFHGLKIDPSWYVDRSPYGAPVVPSMFLALADHGFPGAGFNHSFGNLWIRQEWDMHAPATPGETYRATSKILDIYEWRERTVVKQEVTVWSPNGEMTARGRHHQSYLLSQSSGVVKLRNPTSKEGGRRFTVPPGEVLAPVERTIDLDMCGTFFHGDRNYHTDEQAAEELGFENVVIGGPMTMSYLGDLMDRRFGKCWYEGGRLDVKFTNIVWPNDTVIANGVITERVKENGETRASVSLWMEKQDGTVVIVGTVSVPE